MDTIGDWSHEDHLSLNISRIKFMRISCSKQHSQCPQILLDGTLLEQVFHFKYQECGCQLTSPAPNTLFLLHARHADYWDTFLEPFPLTVCTSYYGPLQNPGIAYSRLMIYSFGLVLAEIELHVAAVLVLAFRVVGVSIR